MLIAGNVVRLTTDEKHQLRGLTGSSPDHITSKEKLTLFVNAHLVNYSGPSPAEQLLRKMLSSFLPH